METYTQVNAVHHKPQPPLGFRVVTANEFFAALYSDPRDIMPSHVSSPYYTTWETKKREVWGWTAPGWKNPGGEKIYAIAMTMTPILDKVTAQGNSIRILATDAAPMDLLVRINGNVRPIREAIYQLNRTREYEARVAAVGPSLYA